MTLDLDDLEAKAHAVVGRAWDEPVAAFVAAASPRAVLALIDEVRRLRAALREALDEAERAYGDGDTPESWATRSSQLRALVGRERGGKR
jgi:hypothetical protein